MTKTIIIDGHSIAYRIFFKVPNLTNSKGEPTGLIHSFINTIISIREKFNPDRFVVTFDSKGETERHKLLEQYKANRPPTPSELISQVEHIKNILSNIDIEIYNFEGVEADDIIYTIANQGDGEVFIVTKDKDLMQIVDDKVKILDYQTGDIIDSDGVKEKLGISPHQVTDYLALAGDTADNIPGVKGVGPKTAEKLLADFQNLENIYKNIGELKGSLREKLDSSKELAFLSKEIATLKIVNELSVTKRTKNEEKLKQLLSELELKTLYKRFFKENISAEHHANESLNKKILIAIEDDIYEFSTEKKLTPFTKNTFDGAQHVYNIKNIYKKTGLFSDKIYDIQIISWLNNPDSGGIIISKGESVSSFSERIMDSFISEIETCKNSNQLPNYFNLELFISKVIADMEKTGIKIDLQKLAYINSQIIKYAESVENEIYQIIETKINLNSPKQLGEILFKRLNIVPYKKTKTGYSTDEESLRNMIALSESHTKLLGKIISYRELTKLVNTYTSKLPEYVSPATGRIHTEFKQTGTATGRFSSVNPNLQNIPLKGEWGKKIREVFIPEDGYMFISLDYSQIELRFLAYFSKDDTLLKAFKDGLDIHKITGSKIFKIPEDEVIGDKRRIAKAVNFGILYGLSPFGLSRDTGVSQSLARDFIDTYFKTYPGVKEYINNAIKLTRSTGYAETILKRRRYFPEINSKNPAVRSRSERMAVNSTLQGSAADVIKMAMFNAYNYFNQNSIDAKLVLQIHDELIFEVHKSVAETIYPKIKEIMENAVQIDVALEVNGAITSNLGEVK